MGLLISHSEVITDTHIKRANAGNTLEDMVAAYRANFGDHGPPDVAEVAEVARMLQHLAEHEACGIETLCWVLADALSRLAKGKR